MTLTVFMREETPKQEKTTQKRNRVHLTTCGNISHKLGDENSTNLYSRPRYKVHSVSL